MRTFLMPGKTEAARMDSAALREAFVVDGLFAADRVVLNYTDLDRAVVGSAVPAGGPLELPVVADLRTAYFCERRELGVLNVGGRGRVIVDGTAFELANLDCLYVGRGSRAVRFESVEPATPAAFYLISYPAHADYPTTLAPAASAAPVKLGSPATSNERTIYKYVHPAGVKSCQLVMGVTQLAAGSVWNTMPPHTHLRRSEVYLYFNLDPAARVLHLMGEPSETRHLVLADREVALSPSWSIHSGCGTAAYAFCWAMGGENQAFDDMDAIAVTDLR